MKQYIVDAFTNRPFSGNPAAVCVMEGWPPDFQIRTFKSKPDFTGDKADALRTKLQCPEGYDFVIEIALGFSTDMKEPHDLREEKIQRI